MRDWQHLLDELSARHDVEAGERPATVDREACLLVPVEPEVEHFVLPEGGIVLPFAAVGGRELAVEAVEFEPAEVAPAVETEVLRRTSAAGWALHEVRIRPAGDGKALAEILATLPRLVVRLRSSADNSAEFSLPVSFLLGRVKVEPAALDLGRLPYFGDTRIEADTPEVLLFEAGRSEPLSIALGEPGAGGGHAGTVALADGVHRIELPGGTHQAIAARPFEKTLRFQNEGLRPLRLQAELGEDVPLYVVPAAFEVQPGESVAVRVRFLPALARRLGPQRFQAAFRLELAGRDRTLPGRIQVPVAVDLWTERATLALETRTLDLGRRRLERGPSRFILPYRLVGKGKVRLKVRFEPDEKGLFDLEKDYAVLKNKDDDIAPGFLSVAIDSVRWFERRLDRFRVVVETDAYLVNRREFAVDGRLELSGLQLADRALRLECHQGLLYQIPLGVWAEEAPDALDWRIERVEGTRTDLASRLSMSEWHHLDALPARIESSAPNERPPGARYALHASAGFLLLDLGGLDELASIDADWIVVLEDPATRFRQELRLELRLHSSRAFVTGETLARSQTDPARSRLEFEVANPTDRAFDVVEVSVEPVRFPGLEPFRVEPRVKIAAGKSKKFGLDLRIAPRGTIARAVETISAVRPTLRLAVRTDLPGGHAIERTIRFHSRPQG